MPKKQRGGKHHGGAPKPHKLKKKRMGMQLLPPAPTSSTKEPVTPLADDVDLEEVDVVDAPDPYEQILAATKLESAKIAKRLLKAEKEKQKHAQDSKKSKDNSTLLSDAANKRPKIEKKSEKPTSSEEPEQAVVEEKPLDHESPDEDSSVAIKRDLDEPDDPEDEFRKHFSAIISKQKMEELSAARQYRDSEVPDLGSVQYSAFLPPLKQSLLQYKVKQRLIEQWQKANKKKFLTADENALFSLMNSYSDLLYTKRSLANGPTIRVLYCLHALNHIHKSRDLVVKNNARQKSDTPPSDEQLQDQGFTRPKVLIVVPFRNAALEVVQCFLALTPKSNKEQVDHQRRFAQEYGPPEEEEEPEDRPADYRELFKGNIDDCFRFGLAFGRKSVKLFTEFYSSDIIVASPLGLHLVIGDTGERERDFDFLSSIEMVIVDQLDTLQMQNFEHVTELFSLLNRIPAKQPEGTDFSRVRPYLLDGAAKYYRQSLLFSDCLTAEISALFSRNCFNENKLKVFEKRYRGEVERIVPKLQLVFQRLECDQLSEIADFRFKYFTEKVFPKLKNSVMKQILIFIPSYFDYVRVRNFFQKIQEDEELTFALCCEYTSQPNLARARTHFRNGRVQFLLYTERLHFFHRFPVRGVQHIVFYSLPQTSHFFSELINSMTIAGDNSCLALYSVFDKFQLERIAGADRSTKMLVSEQETFLLT